MAARRIWRNGAPRRASRPLPTQTQLIDLRLRQNRLLVGQLLAMIAENKALVETLDQEIRTEEQRTGIFDRAHFTYSTIAKAAFTRRDNLLSSINVLQIQLQDVETALAEAMAQAIRQNAPLSNRDAA
jgi:flagellar protein FliJ